MTSLFYLDKSILNKDFFLVPLFLSRSLNAEFNFVYPKNKENENYPFTHRGANLIPINSSSEFEFSFWKERQSIWYIIKHGKKIDVLFLIWLNHRSLLLSFIYKLINPKGFCFIKGDMNADEFRSMSIGSPFLTKLKYNFKQRLFRNVDMLSCETYETYSLIKEGCIGKRFIDRVQLLPNCFDEEVRRELSVDVVPFQQKENIILIVGRIGAKAKNHQMVLDAIDGLDLNDWNIVFVGEIEESFNNSINLFFKKNPQLFDKVTFTGPIYSKNELWPYYNKSKVFLLSSSFEGFPNVFPEALRFGCFIVTTSVSSALDVTNFGKVGKIIDVNDKASLRNFLLNDLMKGKIDFQIAYEDAINLCLNKFLWTINIEKLVDTKLSNILNKKINE